MAFCLFGAKLLSEPMMTLSIRPQGTHFNEILFEIQKLSFQKMHLKISSMKWRPFCLSLTVLIQMQLVVFCEPIMTKLTDMDICITWSVSWARYSVVLLWHGQFSHKYAQKTDRPLGRGMGCLLWVWNLTDILPQFPQLFMQYFTILDHVIMAIDCIAFSREHN